MIGQRRTHAGLIPALCTLAVAAGLHSCGHPAVQEQAGLPIKSGMRVTMEYTVRGADGTVLRTTAADGPFSYVHGRGELRPSLERRLTGMRAGDTVQVRIAASEAFGLVNEAKIESLPRAQFPADVAVGAEYEDQIGRRLRVIEVGEDSVTVDWNHPLAGQDLFVDVVILDVKRPDS